MLLKAASHISRYSRIQSVVCAANDIDEPNFTLRIAIHLHRQWAFDANSNAELIKVIAQGMGAFTQRLQHQTIKLTNIQKSVLQDEII